MDPYSEGIMIPGSAQDLSTHICDMKRKLKDVLLEDSKIDTAQKLGYPELKKIDDLIVIQKSSIASLTSGSLKRKVVLETIIYG